ncbi:AAA family ATPase [Larkinella sp. VNQ87]|uniref:AAA family ATPase n=1 Tax=Larkinella sp. VNQ87 TaxID=3400921 RepID=UPI003BFEAB29
MEKQHLTYFKIENFKRFDSFEMSNLGQFNLIVGDNNVGKTSVLEALLFDEDRIEYLFNLYSTLYIRGLLNKYPEDTRQYGTLKEIWLYIFRELQKPLNIEVKDSSDFAKKIKLELIEGKDLVERDKNFIAQQVLLNQSPELWLRFYFQDEYSGVFGRYNEEAIEFRKKSNYVVSKYISFNVGYLDIHLSSYFQNINSSKKKRVEFENNLKLIINNLEEVRPHKVFNREILGVVLKNDQEIYPIARFGDGVVKIMRILLGIFSVDGERVMIDEIDAGIHYSKLKAFWKAIFLMCHNRQVQLFATTHSLECQQAFIEALQDEDMQQFQQDARNITMMEDKDGQVKAVTYDFEQFEYALNIGFNTRGGKQ